MKKNLFGTSVIAFVLSALTVADGHAAAASSPSPSPSPSVSATPSPPACQSPTPESIRSEMSANTRRMEAVQSLYQRQVMTLQQVGLNTREIDARFEQS